MSTNKSLKKAFDKRIGSNRLLKAEDKERFYKNLNRTNKYKTRIHWLPKFVTVLIVIGLTIGVYSVLDESWNKNIQSTDETSTEEREITKINKGDPNKYEDVLVAEDIQEDVDGDGESERIILNISPAPAPHPEIEGEYLWDSSQVWQLLVEDKGEYYTLFDDHVQGLAELYIVNEKENQNAIVFQQKGTTLDMSVFRYKDDHFEKEIAYSGMILHRSTIR